MEHDSTPWKDPQPCINRDETLIFSQRRLVASTLGKDHAGNAAFIVQAVNLHDDLLEAVRALLADNERAYPAELGNEAARLARAVIAKAEGRAG